MKQPNLHKTLNILLRLTIVGLSLGFIYWKILVKGDFEGLIISIKSFSNSPHLFYGLILVFGLMIVNWSIETFKWQKLINLVEKVSFTKAFQSVLSGITIGIFTPNRTGEFIGRAFLLKNQDPIKAVLMTIVGSLSQLMVTILAGTTALAFSYTDYIPIGMEFPSWLHAGIIGGIILLDIGILAGFFNVPIFSRTLSRFLHNRSKKLANYFQVITSIKRYELLSVFLLSLMRYLVFSFQFFLLFQLFEIDLPLQDAICVIPLIFLALAAIPTVALSELGVRGSVSLYIVGTYIRINQGAEVSSTVMTGIVMAAALLWVINLAIPAIIGIPFIFKLKFFRK